MLKPEEWLVAFKKYKSMNSLEFWVWYARFSDKNPMTKGQWYDVKYLFRKKMRAYERGDESIIVYMTGKKTGPGKGPQKKEPEDFWDSFSREELVEIAKRYKEIQKEKKKSDKLKESKTLNISSKSKVKLFELCRQTMAKKPTIRKSRKNDELKYVLSNLFQEHKGRVGRGKIHRYLMPLGYQVSERTVGRYLVSMGLIANSVTKGGKPREIKDTKDKTPDLCRHQFNDPRFESSDVTYIQTKDGWAYLSATINHGNKFVSTYNFSKYNDLNLVIEHFKNMDLEGKIVHTDHGHQYTSHEFKKLMKDKGATQSMKKLNEVNGNREIEYFWAKLKSEWLNTFPLWKMSFDEVKEKIVEYIEWYNNERIQENLNWKTPAECRTSMNVNF